MKIAFFSPHYFSKSLGATKNRIELAAALEKNAWEAVLIGVEKLGLPANYKSDKNAAKIYSEALKRYLFLNAGNYDVVLYEYDTLPYPRKNFSARTLFIARPALLFYHFIDIKYPVNAKTQIRNVIKKLARKKSSEKEQEQLWEYSLEQADLVQVQNSWDKKVLEKNGFSSEKIIVVPNGIFQERRKHFQKFRKSKKEMKIAFVGTFDFRKGACDFPAFTAQIMDAIPEVKIKLLGTKGLFDNEKEVKAFFPPELRGALEIYPTFDPEMLPELLSDCLLGIYPSYIESFGFGVLEMMTAGLPVVCYNSPGPSDFVPEDLLVEPGDTNGLAKKVIELLTDEVKLHAFSQMVLEISRRYNWEQIALEVSKAYSEHLGQLQQQELEALATREL